MTGKQKKPQRKPQAFAVPGALETEVPVDAKPAAKPDMRRKPRAATITPKLDFHDIDEAFFAAEERGGLDNITPPAPVKPRRRTGLGAITFAAFGLLIAASVGLWIENLVSSILAQNVWLGQATLVAAGIFIIGVGIFVVREILAIMKVRAVSGLRNRIKQAFDRNKASEIKSVSAELESHFAQHPKTAHARLILAENKDEVMDPLDRYGLTERELLSGLDRDASAMVMSAAKRVSVVTAVSPRAMIDIGYVLYENIRLIRRVCEHYGGRSGFVGTISLTRRVLAHLAITGAVSFGDGIVQQLLGHGIASKLSARLGEGVVNGLMTARVGLSAIDVCRPAPFIALPKPRLSDFASSLIKFTGDGTSKKADKET